MEKAVHIIFPSCNSLESFPITKSIYCLHLIDFMRLINLHTTQLAHTKKYDQDFVVNYFTILSSVMRLFSRQTVWVMYNNVTQLLNIKTMYLA